ncbi:MAG: hypothetical protein LBH50_05915 [Spirochaetaceae bacterium]|nr:hypothetical protein [Spirochaetaceae bacterium]
MLSIRKTLLLTAIMFACSFSLFGEERVVGRLVKSSVSGVDTTRLYEPLVTIVRDSVLGVQNLSIRLSGVRPRDSKVYEFYNDSAKDNPAIWRRRRRNVTVRPGNAYISVNIGEDVNTIVVNYEYFGRRGFGNAVYVIAVEK